VLPHFFADTLQTRILPISASCYSLVPVDHGIIYEFRGSHRKANGIIDTESNRRFIARRNWYEMMNIRKKWYNMNCSACGVSSVKNTSISALFRRVLAREYPISDVNHNWILAGRIW